MLNIRQVRESDLSELTDIFKMNRGPDVAWLNPNRPDDNLREQSKGETILVAESMGTLVGFASIWEPENFIHHLYVHRDHQRQGVGSCLVNEIARLFPGDLTLKCGKTNRRAMGFYLNTGWIEVSEGLGPDGRYALLKRFDSNG